MQELNTSEASGTPRSPLSGLPGPDGLEAELRTNLTLSDLELVVGR